ncbi:MAG: nucleotidyltransferase family protein [Clostridiales bacterium]|nr:nucleotidyltransferase family protein [Clostridiales bacterium]
MILAAGYATRLYPLTLDKPKALLKVQRKPIIDYIAEQINTISDIDKIIVISNHKFVNQFNDWAMSARSDIPIKVLDDGTVEEGRRLGAIGDIGFVIEHEHIDDDVVVIAGDNLFTFPLAEYKRFFVEKGGDCVCVRRMEDREACKQLGIAMLDETGRVIDMEEKPAEPKSDCAVFATYMYKRETIPLIKQYLDEGNKPDAPGFFVSWLYKRKPVYAYVMNGECYDIGTPEALKQAEFLALKQR